MEKPQAPRRAKPGDLCNGEVFQIHKEYRTTLPLSEVVNDQFFVPLRDNICPGDRITVCRFTNTTVGRRDTILQEIATVRVVAVSRDAVSLFVTEPITEIPAPEQEVKAA